MKKQQKTQTEFQAKGMEKKKTKKKQEAEDQLKKIQAADAQEEREKQERQAACERDIRFAVQWQIDNWKGADKDVESITANVTKFYLKKYELA